MANEVTRFKVMFQDGKSYAVYYKKSDRWFCYYNIYDEKRGLMILNPSMRVSNISAETAMKNGIEF